MPLFNNNKKIGRVFHGTKEINKIYQGDKLVFQKLKPEGYIEIEVNSSSGSYIVPLSPFSIGANYSFNVFVNGVFYGTTTGFSNDNAGYNITGLNGPTAIIMLTPTDETVPVGWGRAFGHANGTGGSNSAVNKAKLLKVLNDPDYAHLLSETETGVYFKSYEFYDCINLTQIPDEDMPDTVITITNSFRVGQYYGCTSLMVPAREYISNKVTNIGSEFRQTQYFSCDNLTQVPDENMPYTVTTIGNNFRHQQYGYCPNLAHSALEYIPSGVLQIGSAFRAYQYRYCTGLIDVVNESMPDDIKIIGANFRNSQYQSCTSLTQAAEEAMPSGVTTIGEYFRFGQYNNCSNLRIGGYIHSYHFPTLLNGSSNYEQMFNLSTVNSTPDNVSSYYLDSSNTTIAPVTNLTPITYKIYLRNRTGIPNYNTIHPFWK